MKRSASPEWSKRINVTIALLKEKPTTAQVALALMQYYGVSQRQAYRYIMEAKRAKSELPIPEVKVVFTVKLPKSLVMRLRAYAKPRGESLSLLVTQALEKFFKKTEDG
jgi:predicted HicB family RNase H-like nuclease